MSAVAGLAGFSGGDRAGAVEAMLRAMEPRGRERTSVQTPGGAGLGVARDAWETGSALGGPAEVLRRDGVSVATDAAVYYLDDLSRRVWTEGVSLAGDTPADAIWSAYRAWGERCAAHLEGDFSFVLWDEQKARLLAARDFAGHRPLHYAVLDGRPVVASTTRGVLAHPACARRLNRVRVAETAAGLWGGTTETCWEGIHVLPAGHTLTWTPDTGVRVRRHWRPPPVRTADGTASFSAGADELRELAIRATEERAAPGAASVWMSGGVDSTAVFAAARAARVRRREDPGGVVPVTVRYPPDDPGHEDPYVEATAARWDAEVRWLEIGDIPMFEGARAQAADRDGPFAHVYENWVRALARGSRASGARVALAGYGGDQLFQVSDAYLSDLFQRGRWIELAREWSEKDRSGWRSFYRWAVQPRLAGPVRRGIARIIDGLPAEDYLARRPAPWIRDDFVERHGLLARERAARTGRPNGERGADEMHFYLTSPYFPRVSSCLTQIAREEGVEVRTPLYDRRIVEFAARRPRSERNSGSERKRLLRAAMRGLLPDEVLASRPTKTGITAGYFDRATRTERPELFDEAFASPVLESLGIVDGDRLRTAWRRYRDSGGPRLGVALVQTLHTELWLRARREERGDEKRAAGRADANGASPVPEPDRAAV